MLMIEMLKSLLFLLLENETLEIGPQISKGLDCSSDNPDSRFCGMKPSGWG